MKLLRCHEVRVKTGLPVSTIYYLISHGRFPKQIRIIGGRQVRWADEDVDRWIAQQIEANRQEDIKP